MCPHFSLFRRCLITAALLLFARLCAEAELKKFGPYAEPDFPFLESTVDFRDWEKDGFPQENLVIRGVVVKLPGRLYACFDTDLLRLAAVWRGRNDGEFLTWTGIAPISYHVFNKKAEPGQKDLPKPVGTPLYATGPHPGWLLPGESPGKDPRPAGYDSRELGRGPLPRRLGRWLGIDVSGEVVKLRYEIAGAKVEEVFTGGKMLQRQISVVSGSTPAKVILPAACLRHQLGQDLCVTLPDTPGERVGGWLLLPAGKIGHWRGAAAHAPSSLAKPESAVIPRTFVPSVEGKSARLQVGNSPFVQEILPLPLPNPWRRNVRLSGLDFFPDGRAAFCTIDGDVWLVSDLAGSGPAQWRRFASGLNEPQSVQVVNGEIYVFTRTGITRLHAAKDGTCSFYENFCADFPQTAETREYPNDMVKKPGGGFFIAKGGQQISTRGNGGGRIFEVSADGQSVVEICRGLRQPFLGVHPVTGQLTASDQQGHWTPSTPIHVVKRGAYYGYPDAVEDPPPTEVMEPICWIPHEVNQSAAGHVWCLSPKMGPLNGHLLHLAYFKPSLFDVHLDPQGKQGAVVPLGIPLEIPLLKGAINPADGLLYLCGLQIWGTEAKEVSGLVRLRPTGKASVLPEQVRATAEGIFLKFQVPLDAAVASQPQNFVVQRWNYRRTKNYGSPHYKLDGSLGQELLPVIASAVSKDGTGLFLRVANLQPVMQMQVDWRLVEAGGAAFTSLACLTVKELEPFDFTAHGVDRSILTVQAAPLMAAVMEQKATVDFGRTLAAQLGCLACHSTDGKMEGMKGPSWLGLFGSEEELVTGKKIRVDEAHLRESILNPPAKVRKGFSNPDVGMPPYAGVLSDAQVNSLILYLRSLAQ